MLRISQTPITLVLLPFLLAAANGAQSDWLEVASPGRASSLGTEASTGAARAVLDLVPFDGRVYISLAPAREASVHGPIVCYDPAKTDLIEEHVTTCSRLGQYRVIEGRLFVPDAGPDGESGGGYYVTEGGGKWDRVRVMDETAELLDVARHQERTFLAGSLGGKAIVAHRSDAEGKWHVIHLTKQAARWSPRAVRFLVGSDHLTLLAERVPDPNPNVRAAPQAWGAWYVLHYFPDGSDRGFLIDGPARPLPSLRLLAPGSRLTDEPHYLAHDVPFLNGLLYTVLSGGGEIRDEKGCLFYAETGQENPQVGRTFMAQRIRGLEQARDVAIAGGLCYVLLAENAKETLKIVASRDLRKWSEVFVGELDSPAISLAVLGRTCYVGTVGGTLIAIELAE